MTHDLHLYPRFHIKIVNNCFSYDVMETLLKAAPSLAMAWLALFWNPGLEGSQNWITGTLGLSGQIVVLVWLAVSFIWAFAGALIGHIVFSAFLGFIKSQMSHSKATRQYEEVID